MKIISIVTLLTLSVLGIFKNVSAQSNFTSQVPAIVKEAFAHQYPKAIGISWVKRDTSYAVYFRLEKDKSNYSAKWNDKGERLESSREYGVVYNELPEAVKKLVTKQAPDYRPQTLTKVEVKGKPNYYLLGMSKGHLDFCIKYSEDGSILGLWE